MFFVTINIVLNRKGIYMKKSEEKPLKLEWGTMEWRNARVSEIDQAIHAGTEGLRDPHPLSINVRKSQKNLPF